MTKDGKKYIVVTKKKNFRRSFVKQLILPARNLARRILTYYFETVAPKAPSDEGAVSEAD